MKVNNQNAASSAAAGTGCTQDVQKSERNSPQSGKAKASGDHVEFSSTLGRLSQIMANDGSQRNSRVQAVGAAYQNGTYRPDPMAISKAMIAEAANPDSF